MGFHSVVGERRERTGESRGERDRPHGLQHRSAGKHACHGLIRCLAIYRASRRMASDRGESEA